MSAAYRGVSGLVCPRPKRAACPLESLMSSLEVSSPSMMFDWEDSAVEVSSYSSNNSCNSAASANKSSPFAKNLAAFRASSRCYPAPTVSDENCGSIAGRPLTPPMRSLKPIRLDSRFSDLVSVPVIGGGCAKDFDFEGSSLGMDSSDVFEFSPPERFIVNQS